MKDVASCNTNLDIILGQNPEKYFLFDICCKKFCLWADVGFEKASALLTHITGGAWAAQAPIALRTRIWLLGRGSAHTSGALVQ